MSEELNDDDIDIMMVFTALTRPPMIYGVTIEYLFIAFMCSVGLFFMTANPWFVCFYIPLHLFGYAVCRHDPNFFKVLFSVANCPGVRNKKIWGVQSYEPF